MPERARSRSTAREKRSPTVSNFGQIDTELAIQGLQECIREKKASMDEIWEAAKICRVASVIRPYMESLA
jgi:hypothetical protein